MGYFTEMHNKQNIMPVTLRSSSCEEIAVVNFCNGCKQTESNGTFSHVYVFTEHKDSAQKTFASQKSIF